MEFTVEKSWESSGTRMASRQISKENQVSVKTLIDEILDKEEIIPWKVTAWSSSGKETKRGMIP